MMQLLRNKEVKYVICIYGVLSFFAVTLTGIWDVRFGLVTFFFCGIFIAFYLLATQARYKKIEKLSGDINRILHGEVGISLESYEEGELGILQSELQKVLTCLREQQERLVCDKIYLSDSIADISHQIRTPLTSIHLLVSLLGNDTIGPEQKKKSIRELQELLDRIEWLIVTLLKISKLDTGTITFKKENISLENLLQRAAAPVLIPMELRMQELELVADGEFEGDIAWTCEALTNILKNCMEHTPLEGNIWVHAAENPLYTEIVISDNGEGIEQEDLPHIFERFYKGKDSVNKNFGIGLSLARMIVTRQNGTIKAENRIERGAQFIIRFYKGTV